ncbi:MAG: 23S rRNA (adenine(2503)-C(2))-methyltransferase RlmN [Phycisphaerales bacterium]
MILPDSTPMSPRSDALNPMGLTCRAMVEALGATNPAREREIASAYAAFFRRAETEPLHALGIHADTPTPVRTLTTDSPEGDVVKFLLEVPQGGTALRAVSPDPHSANGVDSKADGSESRATLQTESVIIPMKRRHETTRTLCVSSQVGCAMGCTFCETAQMGLIRSLTAAEIVQQWFAATHAVKLDPAAQPSEPVGQASSLPSKQRQAGSPPHQFPIKNIVFMGMGEPLDNLDNVISAVEILTDHYGPAVPMSGITISTVGRIDGLMKLREHVQRPGWKQLNLAVSINAPNDEIRSKIMPVNRSMPLGELIPILETWPRRKSGAICAEYVLIPGVNDSTQHAHELCTLLKGVRCCVNVIPYNPRRGSPWEAPAEATVDRFLSDLEANGQFCKRRRTKGRDTMAACGQLGNEHIRQRKFVGVTMTHTDAHAR